MYTRFLALSLMTFLALRRGVGKLRIPAIMGTIVEGSLWYFLVTFTSRLVLEMIPLLGRVSVTAPSSVRPMMPNACAYCTGIYSTTSQLVEMPSRESRARFICAPLYERPTDDFRYLPVMISRLMLSLKKAVNPQKS